MSKGRFLIVKGRRKDGSEGRTLIHTRANTDTLKRRAKKLGSKIIGTTSVSESKALSMAKKARKTARTFKVGSKTSGIFLGDTKRATKKRRR